MIRNYRIFKAWKEQQVLVRKILRQYQPYNDNTKRYLNVKLQITI